MSNVVLPIGGRNYTVACADGEEAHVIDLARDIDERMAAIPGLGGQSDPRAFLYVALLLADEVHRLKQTAQTPAVAEDGGSSDSAAAEIAAAEALADRLEALAGTLEDGQLAGR